MSHSFSKVIDYQGDYYKDGDWSPSTSRYLARLHFHHTSDTVTWQRTEPLAENMRSMFKDRLVMSNEEYDALSEAIESSELIKLRGALSSVVGLLNRRVKKTDTKVHLIHSRPHIFGSDDSRAAGEHREASRILEEVKWALKQAGLELDTIPGQPSQPQPQSPSQPEPLPESQTQHLKDPGIAD